MSEPLSSSLLEHFSALPDPRYRPMHPLSDVLVIAICALICGADSWVAIEAFGKAKQEWFATFLRLPHGIPSHDTFGRVFALLDTQAFAQCFADWSAAVATLTAGEVVAIDGKTLRRSFDHAAEKAAIHMVSAWASQNRVVLGQIPTDEKSNEITAIPRLLRLLQLKGCIVTCDAMGCQRAIAQAIVDQEADYILQVKGNQPNLLIGIESFFFEALRDAFDKTPYDYYEMTEKGHGRIETRKVWCSPVKSGYVDTEAWANLSSFIRVEATRQVGEKKSQEVRYYISSLPGTDAREAAHAVRRHWSIENGLHWVLDVAFREDDARARIGNAAANLAILRHLALTLLKQEASAKVGIKTKRLKAGWDHHYLLKVLGF